MRIAVNARLLLKGKMEGIGWFAYETLKRITQDHPEHEFIFIFDRKPDLSFVFSDNVKSIVAHPQARHPILWYLFFEFGVAKVLKNYKPDLFISPDGWLSLRSKTKSLAVIHDLNFAAHSEFLPRHIAAYYKYFFPRFAEKADRIATVSEYTKQDIHQRYKVPLSRIDVVYNGANEIFRAMERDEIHAWRHEYSSDQPYFLFVGLIHPRKNLENQLRAFIKYKKDTSSTWKFVVVGAPHWWSAALEEITQKSEYKDDIILLGRQSIENLVGIYGAAHALMYVSHFEGFGIPIVEAFRAGIPVITSNTTSMPEIAGEAGLLVDPNSVTEIADAMTRIATDEVLRQQLIEKGRVQGLKFSWDKTAELLWESIEKVLKNS